MAKTRAEYIEEQNRAAQAETEKRWKQREEQDAAYIASNNSAVDQSTAAALKPYETRMEQLPEEYRKQYDYNAVEELVRQKQVAETMANLGLTDSGLNRTQQTAIAVSRGNADAAARLSQQEKTQELQDKMDQLKATGEIQKQQTAAEVKANSQAWYNNLQSAAYENAANRGTALYEAEQQRLADAAALQKQLEWQNQQAELQRQEAAAAARKQMLSRYYERLDKIEERLNGDKVEFAKIIHQMAPDEEAEVEFADFYNVLDELYQLYDSQQSQNSQKSQESQQEPEKQKSKTDGPAYEKPRAPGKLTYDEFKKQQQQQRMRGGASYSSYAEYERAFDELQKGLEAAKK